MRQLGLPVETTSLRLHFRSADHRVDPATRRIHPGHRGADTKGKEDLRYSDNRIVNRRRGVGIDELRNGASSTHVSVHAATQWDKCSKNASQDQVFATELGSEARTLGLVI